MSKYYSSSIAFGAEQTKTEQVVVSPTMIGNVTTDAVSGALTVDEVPTLDSLNPVSSDGVARAVIQAGAELPTRGSSDTGKVLTVANSDGDLEWDTPEDGIPDMTGKNGKVLGAVDNGGTMEAQWVNPPDSYPSVTGNAGKVLKVNAGATGVEWANESTVTVDQNYNASSTNAQSGTAVAGALETIKQVPAASSGDFDKILGVTDTSGTVGWVSKPASVSVDQNYNAYSENAQSGTAVAGAISTIKQVPASTSADENKVLSVNAQGAPEWVTPSGGTQYSAGDGIGIDANNVISADVDGVTIGIDASTKKIKSLQSIPSKTSDLQNDSGFITSADIPAQVNADWTSNSGASEILHKPDLSIYAQSANLATVATTGDYSDLVNKPAIPAAQVNSDWNASSGVAAILNKPSLATVATTGDYSDLQNKPSIPAAQVNADWNSSSGVSEILNKPSLATVATTGAYSDLTGTPTIPSVDQTYNASSTNAQSGVAVAGALATVKQVPASTSADENKVLTVNSSGNPVWETSSVPASKPLVAGANITITDGVNDVTIAATVPTVDQTYDASSANAQSGVAVASAISGINAVPASTSADQDKVLTVNSSGTPVWAESQGGGGGGGGGGTTVDYTDDSYWEAVLKSKIVATDSCYAILKFADASYDPSAVSDVTSVFTVTRLSEYSENVWLFERPSSVTSSVFLSSTLITVNYEILGLAYNAPSIGVDFDFVEGYRCTRIGNIFPVPGSSYSTLYARFYITSGSTSVKSIGLIDLSFFRGTTVEWYIGNYYTSDLTVSNLPITSIGGVVAYSWSYMQFRNTFARTKITKAPPFYRYGSGNVLVRENEISPATIDAMFQGCDQMTEIDTVLTLQSVTNAPDYGSTYNNRYCFEGCRKLSKVAGVKITVYNGASYKPLSLVNMFSLCDALTYNPLILAYAPPSGDASTMHAIYLDKLFYRSGIENYLGAIRCAYNTNWKPVSLESLATTTTSMFEGAYKLTNVSMCFGKESPLYVTKTKVDNMFKYCAALKDTAKLYASLNSVISPSATSSDTQDAFTKAGVFAPDYATNQSQIPSTWGGTGA